jgi:hypothetical protein
MAIIVEGSINGTPAVQGGQELAATDTLQLSLRPNTMAGVAKVLWEIYEYPPAGVCPDGWETQAGAMRFWYSATAATDLRPPLIDFTGQAWGKWFIRATANDGLVGGVATPSMIDESFAVSIESPANLEDVGALEAEQFGPLGNIGALKRLIRDLNGITMPEPGPDGEILTSDGTEWASEPFPFGSPVAVGSANADGSAVTAPRADHVHAHGNQGGGTLHALATHAVPGFMSAEDKEKLDGLVDPDAGWLPEEVTLGFDFTDLGTIQQSRPRVPSQLTRWTLNDPPPSATGGFNVILTSGIYGIHTLAESEWPEAPSTAVVELTLIASGSSDPWETDHENIGRGPATYGALLKARTCPRAHLRVNGSAIWGWFDLVNGVTGDSGGDAGDADSGMVSVGDGWYWCWVSGSLYGGSAQLYLYPAEAGGAAPGSPGSHMPDNDPLIYARQAYQGKPGVFFHQPRCMSIESIGSRKTSRAQQTVDPTYQPILVVDPWDGECTGATFSWSRSSANIVSLDITDPRGAYDLIDELSEAGTPWALYVVASGPADTSSNVHTVFTMGTVTGATYTRYVWAGFYGANWTLVTREDSASEESVALAHGSPTKELFSAYYRASDLNVRVGAASATLTTKGFNAAERYSYATIGGGPKGLSTSVPPYSADATIFGFYLAIGDIAVGSDADARIVAAIRAHHGLAV